MLTGIPEADDGEEVRSLKKACDLAARRKRRRCRAVLKDEGRSSEGRKGEKCEGIGVEAQNEERKYLVLAPLSVL